MRTSVLIPIVLLLTAMLCSAVVADPAPIVLSNYVDPERPNEPGNTFTYECSIYPPGTYSGDYYPTWGFFYTLYNNSSNFSVTSWTYSDGGTINVMPVVGHEGFGDPWPLAPSAPGGTTIMRQEYFESLSTPKLVDSVITWSNGVTAHANIYVPTVAAVPEPGSLLALLTGLVSLGGYIRRRKG